MMASRALALSCVCAILHCLAVPLDLPDDPDVVYVTDVVTSSVNVLDTATYIVTIAPSPPETSVLLFPGSPMPAVSSSSPLVMTTDVTTDTVTTTITDPPTTVTVSAPPTTVTDVTTIFSSPPATTGQTAWAAPAQMTDLAAFNVTNFAYGQKNMRIVPSSPPTTTNTTAAFVADADALAIDAAPTTWNSSSAALELFYPADSVNPASSPQGGADFYAVPLDLARARNVSLAYSVFFPADFDWVQAGKLPGLYGGRTGCSGGDAATTCFSTRLMWRAGGAGELYLYAPKDRQSAALCATPPASVCDAPYGLSIGRGAFGWAAGAWTHVRQTVVLNTPGVQDGAFVLEVDGARVIDVADVFYRDVPGAEGAGGGGDAGADGSPVQDPASGDSDGGGDGGAGDDGTDDPGGSDDAGCGLLGLGCDLYGVIPAPVSGGVVVRDGEEGASSSSSIAGPTPSGLQGLVVQETLTDSLTSLVTFPASTDTVSWTMTSMSTAFGAAPTDVDEQVPGPEPVGFVGLFFSTFFGGHDPTYATPKDQYAWFKDFSMTINS